jgi:hypothetical protein
MKRNGLVTLYLIFIKGMMFPGRHTTSGRTGTRRRESKDYQIALEDLIISSTRK